MSYIELGLEKGYIEKQPSEDEKVEVYIVNPRKIMLEVILTSIIEEFKELGYTVDFDDRKKVFIVNNLNLLKKEKAEKETKFIEVEDKIMEEPTFGELKDHFIGTALAYVRHINPDEAEYVISILGNMLVREAILVTQTVDYKKLFRITDEGEKLLEEFNELIRSME